MNKPIMMTVPLLVLAFYGTSQFTTAQGITCEPPTAEPPACQPGRQVTITNGPNIVAPPNLCIAAGDTVTFNVRPPGTTASVEGKDGGWPNDSGSGNSMQLVVPDGKPYYDYNVHFQDGTCLDPRITISQ